MILALIGFLATVNPAAAASHLERDRRGNRPLPVAAGALLAAAALVVVAAVADGVLDALDTNLGTYRLGAGVVVTASGLWWLLAGTPPATSEPVTDRGLASYVAFPALLTPAAAALAVSIGAEESLGAVAVGAAAACALGGLALYLRRSIPAGVAGAAVRILGAVAVIVGIVVAVDGIRTL